MRRYFFHIVGDAQPIKDDEGETFASDDGARTHAAVLASQLATYGKDYSGLEVQVIDERGREVGRKRI